VEDPAVGETSWPFNEGPGADPGEAGWTRMARHFACYGVIGDPNGSTLQVYADSTGMVVKVMPGTAWLRGHMYRLDETLVLPIDTNPTGSARVDRVVLRLDPDANEVTAEVVRGTAGAGAPAVTQTDVGVWEMALGRVTVAPSAPNIAASAVTNDRVGQGLDVHPVLGLSQLSNPRRGHLAYVIPADTYYGWNGSQWRAVQYAPEWAPYTPVWSGAYFGAGASRSGRFLKIGRSCRSIMTVGFGDGSNVGAETLAASLPFPAASLGTTSGRLLWIGSCVYQRAQAVAWQELLVTVQPGAAAAGIAPPGGSSPTTDGFLTVDISYETAS
jgi:hypothetical protein